MAATDNSLKLQDRSVLIFGPFGASVQAVATRLTELGANVGMAVPTQADANRTFERVQKFAETLSDAREINTGAGRSFAFNVDTRNRKQVVECPSKVAEAFGGLDIFVDLSFRTENTKFADFLPENWERPYIDNLEAPLTLAQASLKYLAGKKRGRMIFILPDLLRMGFAGHSIAAAYRGALIPFSRSLAREVLDQGVTVNCIASGVTEDFLLSHAPTGKSIQAAMQSVATLVPTAQLMDSEKLASLVAFVASPLSNGITGQTLVVSQGLTTST